jgi:hypothetical protein
MKKPAKKSDQQRQASEAKRLQAAIDAIARNAAQAATNVRIHKLID